MPNLVNVIHGRGGDKGGVCMNTKLVVALKNGRKNMGLTQTDVAEMLEVKVMRISDWENGVYEPSIDTFFQLCKLYELDVISLLNDAYGLDLQEAHMPGFPMNSTEKELIGKYRGLDEHGREIVDLILQKELERVVK